MSLNFRIFSFLKIDIDDPDEPNDTGYPDTLEMGTGIAQDPDPATCPGAVQEGTFTPCKETPSPGTDSSGSEKATRSKNKPGGTKDKDVGTIPYAPVLDVFLRKPHRGRPPGVKLINTARVRFEVPILDSKPRGEVNIADEFSSQTGVQGVSPQKDKTCEPTSDMILFSKRLHGTEFPILTKTTLEADHNFYPWRGPELMGKWTDIEKRKIKYFF